MIAVWIQPHQLHKQQKDKYFETIYSAHWAAIDFLFPCWQI